MKIYLLCCFFTGSGHAIKIKCVVKTSHNYKTDLAAAAAATVQSDLKKSPAYSCSIKYLKKYTNRLIIYYGLYPPLSHPLFIYHGMLYQITVNCLCRLQALLLIYWTFQVERVSIKSLELTMRGRLLFVYIAVKGSTNHTSRNYYD